LLFCPLLLQKGDKGGPAGFGFLDFGNKKSLSPPQIETKDFQKSHAVPL